MAAMLDDLSVRLPGRLLTLEIVLTLLLRERAGADRLLAEADAILAKIEAEVYAPGVSETDGYAPKMFAAARETLDQIAHEAKTLRRR